MALVETLIDVMNEDNGLEVPITIRTSSRCIEISALGYGDKMTSTGHGVPIILEVHEGELRVVIWSDINKEDPTHIISLANARESNRNG
jgi:hypothetical protein